MQWLSKSCHFMHLMQNRCTQILQAQGASEREREIQPGYKGWRAVGGGEGDKKIIIQLEVGGAVTKNFIIFHLVSRRQIVHIVIFPCIHEPLNNLGSFGGRSFPFFSPLINQSSGQRCSITPAEGNAYT